MSPEHWPTRSLASLAKYLNGFAFKPEHWQKDGLPIIRIEQINDPDSVCDFTTLAIPPENIIDNGDLVFSWSATLKVVIWQNGKAALNQHLFKVLPAPDVDRDFLFFLLDHFMDDIGAGSHGSTMKHIKRSELERFLVKLPPLPIQQAIGSVLRSATRQLDQTEALIAKQERVRAGLLQDLFTRGVDQNGALRPPREEAPDLYHQTELGWLPKGWELKACSSICIKIIDCKNRTPPITSEGHAVFRTPNVRDGKFVDEGLVYTDLASYHEWTRRGEPEVGDVLITREAPVGEVCLVPDHHPRGCLGQRMMLYRCDPALALPKFLVLALQDNRVKRHLDLISGGSTVGHVRVGDIRDLKVPWCPVPEQEHLVSLHEKIALPIAAAEASLDKLHLLKSALMQDLLTGRVSVAPLLQAQAA